MKKLSDQYQAGFDRLQRQSKHVMGGLLLCASLPVIAAGPWPVGTPDQVSATSNQLMSIPVIQNDTGEGLEIIEVNTTTVGLGTASINADGVSVSYRSASDFEGTDSFWYAFKDDEGRTNAAKVTVTVISDDVTMPPEWPVAGTDQIETSFNTPVEIPVLANDQGVDLKLTSVNTTTVGLGKAKISADGKKILYTPASNYTGTDEFWYVFSDNWGRTNAGRVTPVVKPDYSGWPQARPDYAQVTSTTSVAIPVLDNDFGDTLKLLSVNTTTVALGSARIEENYIRYTPPAGFTGKDSFWYDFEDAQGRKNSTQIFVTVSENTELSKIAFCGTSYSTDGTKENTTSGDGLDALAVALDTSVGVVPFPAQAEGDFAVVGERRYFVKRSGSENTLWVEKSGVERVVAMYVSEEVLYPVGIKGDTLFFVTYPVLETPYEPGQPIHAAGPAQILLSHDGSSVHELGSFRVSTGGKISLMDNLSKTYFRYSGYKNIGRGPDVVYRTSGEMFLSLNETSKLAENAHLNKLVRALDITTQAMFDYNGVHYSSDEGVRTISSGTRMSYLIRHWDHWGSSPVTLTPGVLDQAVISNDRLLIATKGHTNVTTYSSRPDVLEVIPPTLYTVNLQNEFVELAVCND